MESKLRESYTEEEAKEERKRSQTKQARVFCPLINNVCHEQCVCLMASRYYETASKGRYYVVPAYCDNAMFSGDTYARD